METNKRVDLVIPYKKSSWQEDELRFMLRSVEKYLSGVGKVFIVGDLLHWLKNVEHIPCTDFDNHKQASICKKMMAAAMDERVSEDFIRNDDDCFFLKYFHVNDIKHWYSGTLQEWQDKAKGVYKDVIFNTKVQFSDKDRPYFDLHAPMPMNKTIIREKMQYIIDGRKEHLIKSSYCYLAGVEGVQSPEKDLKIAAPRVDWEIRALIKNRNFFSTDETRGMNGAMNKVLGQLYNVKSKYEI